MIRGEGLLLLWTRRDHFYVLAGGWQDGGGIPPLFYPARLGDDVEELTSSEL